MSSQRLQLEATFLGRLQPSTAATPAKAPAEQGELAGRRRDPSLFYLALDRIRPDANQARRFNKSESDPATQELAASIRSVGVLQPIDVRYVRDGDFYQIVAGERRYVAARLAGLTEIPVKLVEATDEEVCRLQILENIHREQLSPLELGTALLRILDHGASTEELSQLMCKSSSFIAKALSIGRNLSAEAREAVANAPERFQSMAHLYEVSLLPQAEQEAVVARLAQEDLSREQLQDVTAEIKQKPAPPKPDRGGRPAKQRPFIKTIALEHATVTVRMNKPAATPLEVAEVLQRALDSLD